MQTTIEWLWEQIDGIIPYQDINTSQLFIGLLEQAKEMEKKQMCDFFREGYMWCNSPSLHMENGKVITSTVRYGELYYERTYGSKGSETKEYPHSHIYETIGGKYGLSSYNEHDQTDGIFDSYQEAVDFGLSKLKNK